MAKETSLYLDLVRFTAAFLVLIAHSAGGKITGGFLWPLANYGQTAVMVFFVLSGYVIAYVSQTREHTITDYIYARVSRLYSVIIPAIILSLICNELGNIYIQEQYKGPWDSHEQYEYYRYLSSLFMVQNIWGLPLTPINNGSFWSISFEVFYYILFALFFYLANFKYKLISFLVVALIAGPTIMLLFPIWLLGYFVYKIHSNNQFILEGIGAYIVFFLSIVVLIFSPFYRDYFDTTYIHTYIQIDRKSLVGDYIDGLTFFCHLLAVPYIAQKARKILFKFSNLIVFFASLTFSFYLFHLPLVRLLAGISPFIENPSSILNRSFVLLGTFFIVLLVGLPCERYKRKLNLKLREWVNRIYSDCV